jgi:hypothetical protein
LLVELPAIAGLGSQVVDCSKPFAGIAELKGASIGTAEKLDSPQGEVVVVIR